MKLNGFFKGIAADKFAQKQQVHAGRPVVFGDSRLSVPSFSTLREQQLNVRSECDMELVPGGITILCAEVET